MRSATTVCDRVLALAVVLVTTACEVATGGALASSGVGFGGSLGEDDVEHGSSSTSSDDDIGKTDGDDDDMPKPGIDDGTSGDDTSGDDTNTGDATTTSEAETSTTAAENELESSSGDAPVEPWSACFGGGCGGDMVCMSVPMQEGVCTQACAPAGDATSCPAAPGGLDTVCVELDGTSWCAIDCSFAECPAGTDCFVVADDHAAARICL